MYNPDVGFYDESPEIALSKDRLDKLKLLTGRLHDKAGYGVTRRGDRLTIREHDKTGKYYEIEMVILEVKLHRDYELERILNEPDGK